MTVIDDQLHEPTVYLGANRLFISVDCNWHWENGKRLFEGAEGALAGSQCFQEDLRLHDDGCGTKVPAIRIQQEGDRYIPC